MLCLKVNENHMRSQFRHMKILSRHVTMCTYWRFGWTTCPILHPKYGCRFLQKQISYLHDASIQKTVTVTHTFPTTQNFTWKHYNFLSQSFQPKTVRQDFQHTNKETSLRFTVQITRKCTVRVFTGIKTSTVLKTHTHTHTHTHRTLNEMHRFLFSGRTALFLAAFLRFLFGTE